MKKIFFTVGAIFFAVAAAAGAAPPTANERYAGCLNLTKTDPRAALGTAQKWSAQGGGVPARHCMALSLVALARYAGAAAILDALAHDKEVANGSLRASLLDQAGNAWMLGGDPAKAEASFAGALTLAVSDPDLFADMARAKAMRKDWNAAEANLNEALRLAPGRADLLVLRANAREALGDLKNAFIDVNRALVARPQFADALVERGSLKLEAGDRDGARKDWQAAMAAEPKSEAARTADERLKTLDAVKPAPQK